MFDVESETAARLYSLISSCCPDKLDPHRHLAQVLEHSATHRTNRLKELLPWRVAARLQAPVLASAA